MVVVKTFQFKAHNSPRLLNHFHPFDKKAELFEIQIAGIKCFVVSVVFGSAVLLVVSSLSSLYNN